MKKGEKYTGTNRKAKAMEKSVKAALESFCGQNAEFREAVEQGGSLTECLDYVAKGVGGYISDIDAYRKAVEFFFQGAEVRTVMEIVLQGDEPRDVALDLGGIINLEAFL